jgi:hypothetical protein
MDHGATGEALARSRANAPLAHLLCARGEDGLEMRTLLFPRHHPDVDVFEARLFEEIVELHFAEAEPVIEIKLAGFLKLMAEQIEDDHASIFSQQAMGGSQGPFRSNGVMQRLAENRQIDTFLCDRRILHIAQPVFQILETVFFGQAGSELNHFRGVIDRDHFAGILREQLRESPFPRSQISHGQRRQ